jgi:hypothetical protein
LLPLANVPVTTAAGVSAVRVVAPKLVAVTDPVFVTSPEF